MAIVTFLSQNQLAVFILEADATYVLRIATAIQGINKRGKRGFAFRQYDKVDIFIIQNGSFAVCRIISTADNNDIRENFFNPVTRFMEQVCGFVIAGADTNNLRVVFNNLVEQQIPVILHAFFSVLDQHDLPIDHFKIDIGKLFAGVGINIHKAKRCAGEQVTIGFTLMGYSRLCALIQKRI